MAVNVAIDAIADAMVQQITANLVPTSGGLTSLKPVYSAQRYMGAEFQTQEGFERGIAGRCPAVRVRYAGTKTLRATIGRRTERVESTFSVVVATDARRGRNDRQTLFTVCEAVRKLIGSRKWGLDVTPMRFQRMDTLRDDDKLTALALIFAVRHRVDYTVDPGTDVMNESRGSIVNAAVAHTSLGSPAHAPTVTPQGTPGSTTWAYGIVGIDSDGKRTLISPIGTTSTGNATLTGSNFNRLAWPAMTGIVTYEIERTSAGGTPNTTGKIGTTTALTFNDTGLASLGATPPDSLHVDIHDVFP